MSKSKKIVILLTTVAVFALAITLLALAANNVFSSNKKGRFALCNSDGNGEMGKCTDRLSLDDGETISVTHNLISGTLSFTRKKSVIHVNNLPSNWTFFEGGSSFETPIKDTNWWDEQFNPQKAARYCHCLMYRVHNEEPEDKNTSLFVCAYTIEEESQWGIRCDYHHD